MLPLNVHWTEYAAAAAAFVGICLHAIGIVRCFGDIRILVDRRLNGVLYMIVTERLRREMFRFNINVAFAVALMFNILSPPHYQMTTAAIALRVVIFFSLLLLDIDALLDYYGSRRVRGTHTTEWSRRDDDVPKQWPQEARVAPLIAQPPSAAVPPAPPVPVSLVESVLPVPLPVNVVVSVEDKKKDT